MRERKKIGFFFFSGDDGKKTKKKEKIEFLLIMAFVVGIRESNYEI